MKGYCVIWMLLVMSGGAIAEPNHYFADANCRLVDMKNPPKLKTNIFDRILKENNEKLLLDSYDLEVGGIVVAVCEPYEKVNRELIEIASKRYGVKSMEDLVERDHWKGAVFEKEVAKLERLGLNMKKLVWRKITTKKYNVVENIEGYSELKIGIVDGNSIFSKPCAIVTLVRTDYFRDWTHIRDLPIYLPFKVRQSYNVITENEVELMKELGVRIGYKKDMKIFETNVYGFPLDTTFLVLRLKEVIDQCSCPVKIDDPNTKTSTNKSGG